MEQNQPAQSSPNTNSPEQTQSDIKMQTSPNNFLIPVLVVLVILLSATTAFLGYQNRQLTQRISQMEQKVSPTPSPLVDPTANWKTYSFANYPINFKYPNDAVVSQQLVFNQKTSKNDLIQIKISNKSFGEITIVPEVYYYGAEWDDENQAPKEVLINNIPLLINGESVIKHYLPMTGGVHCGKGPCGSAVLPYPNKIKRDYVVLVSFDANDPPSYPYISDMFDQILSTFQFIDLAEQRALEEKISLVSTSDWKRVKLEKISFLIPSYAKYEIWDNSQNKVVESCEKNCIGLIYVHTDEVYPGGDNVTISTSKYEGVSRREQFWRESTDRTICKPIYQEGVFGPINALQIAIDYGECQGGGGGIVAVLGDQFIVVGTLQRDPNNLSQILRYPLRDTIVSTLKLEN